MENKLLAKIFDMQLWEDNLEKAVDSGKTKIGGLGENKALNNKVVARGTGKNVKANRQKWKEKYGSDYIDGYITLKTMQNALKCGKPVYKTLFTNLMIKEA